MRMITEHIPEGKQALILELALSATGLYPSVLTFTVSVFIKWHLHEGLN